MEPLETTTNKAVPRNLFTVILLWWALAGSILFNVVYFSLGAISTHYDMMRQTISDLELLRHGWIQSVNFIVFGLSVCAFAVALRNRLQNGFGAVLLQIFHWLTGLGLILAGIFIHEPVHSSLLILSFVSVLASFVLFAIRFAGDPRWKGWATYTILSTVLMLLAFARFAYCHYNDYPYAGIFERLVVVVRLAWVIFFIIKLLEGRRLQRQAWVRNKEYRIGNFEC